jgi:SNF2 family DNA or RNA helicase
MALFSERLATEKIEYLEIDGSTPTAERARSVDAFRRSEGDVFVIS